MFHLIGASEIPESETSYTLIRYESLNVNSLKFPGPV